MTIYSTKMGGPVAVVTGGFRGIGAATVGELTAMGYRAFSLDLDADAGNAAQILCDLSDVDQLVKRLDEITELHGPIEVLVNNAGVFEGLPFLDITPAHFDRTIAVNLKAMFFACQHVIRAMLNDGRRGRVVNVASAAGRMGSPFVEYGASKAGVIGLTKGLARIVADRDIRVNAVAPGQVVTDLHRRLSPERQAENLKIIPMRRSGQPEEIAKVIAFLVSDASSFMTGAILDANGGKH